MTMLDLTSVRAKLVRAQEHAQTIKNEILAWTERSPYSLTNEVNADSNRYSIFVHINEPPPLQRWSLMVADCISNLRAALDHLVYSIAVKEATPNTPVGEDKLLFPITDSRMKFDEAVKGGRLGMISEPIRAAIESFQPYNRPHHILPPFLRLLRDFNNRDKHKLLQIAFSVTAFGDVGFIGEHPMDGRVITSVPRVEPLEDGAEIFAVVYGRRFSNRGSRARLAIMSYLRTSFD